MAGVGGGSKKKNTCWQFESSLVSLECSHGLSEEKASHFADSEFVTVRCIFNMERSSAVALFMHSRLYSPLSLSCYRITIQHHTAWHSATVSDTVWRGRHVTSSLLNFFFSLRPPNPPPPPFCSVVLTQHWFLPALGVGGAGQLLGVLLTGVQWSL